MNEPERLLAEGPRIAPEPELAQSSPSEMKMPKLPDVPSRAPQGVAQQSLVRFIPFAAIVILILATRLGAGPWMFWAIVPLVIGSRILARQLQRRR